MGLPRLCAALLLATVAVQLWVAGRLWAFPAAARKTQNACVACHVNPAGGAELTAAGTRFKQGKALTPAPAKKADYVGANRCRTCHIQQHRGWAETAHAHSMTTLASAHPDTIQAMAAKLKIQFTGSADKTEACVTCHVTGFQLPGGYPHPDSARNQAVAAVGCESCHGPGSLHVSAAIADKKKTIHLSGEAMCRQCHTPVLSPDFDFAEYAKRGVHAMKKAGS